MKRETGYYWIKLNEDSPWYPAHYDAEDKTFFVPLWGGQDYEDKHIHEINETRIKNPDEK